MFSLEGLAVHECLFLFFYRLFNKIICLYYDTVLVMQRQQSSRYVVQEILGFGTTQTQIIVLLLCSLVVLECSEDANSMFIRNVDKHLPNFTFFLNVTSCTVRFTEICSPKYEALLPGNLVFLEITAVDLFCLLPIIRGGLHVHVIINILVSEIASGRD
jgi:hypothetical protein